MNSDDGVNYFGLCAQRNHYNIRNKKGGGTTLNFASITGTIGLKNLGKNNDREITVPGGLGIFLGAEIYKTNNSFAIDLSPFFINLRVEYTWAR